MFFNSDVAWRSRRRRQEAMLYSELQSGLNNRVHLFSLTPASPPTLKDVVMLGDTGSEAPGVLGSY